MRPDGAAKRARRPIVMVTVPALIASAVVMLSAQLVAPANAAAESIAPVAKQVTLTVDEATYTSTEQPNIPQGSHDYLLATKTIYRTFLKFDTSSLGSSYKVRSASLQIKTISLDVTTPGVQVYAASSSWSAATLTAANRPAATNNVLAPLFMPTKSATQSIALADTSTVSLIAPTSFELGYGASASNYALAKSGNAAPRLVVDLVPAGIPSPPPAGKTVTIPLSEATYINNNDVNASNNGKNYLLATKQTYRSFVKFDTTVVGSAFRVASAGLQITTISLGVIDPGVQVYATTSNWSANTLTAATRPIPSSNLLAPLFMPTKSATQLIRLSDTSTIMTTASTSFELGYEAANSNYALAKVGGSAPKLVLDLVPAATPTSPSTVDPPPTSSSSNSSSSASSTAVTTSATSVSASPPTTASTIPAPTGSGSAAIDIPPASAHKKLVFAHYFTPYPVSLDNLPAARDYYTTNYLNASGEGGKFASVGGLLRDRPIPRDPGTGNWKLENLKTEVRQAIASGIDGFTVDVLSLSGPNWDALNNLMSAAESVNPNFKIMLMPDMTSSTGSVDAAALASKMGPLAARPSAYRLADGRAVIAPFKGEAKAPAWWTQFMSAMSRNYSIKVAFMPVFLNAAANMAGYASISYGMSEWGVRDPASAKSRTNLAALAHSLGSKWMAPIAVQDVRPNQGVYDEANNTELLRTMWSRAIDDDADFAQLVTWNDYSESTSFAPSANHGYSFLDVNALLQSEFQTGTAPKIVHDAIYLTHRIQMSQQTPIGGQTRLMTLRNGSATPARDDVEIVTALTAGGDVKVVVGGLTYTYSAPAGFYVKLFPLRYGTVSAMVSRSGTTAASVTSPYRVSAAIISQDLQYYAASSLRPNPRTN